MHAPFLPLYVLSVRPLSSPPPHRRIHRLGARVKPSRRSKPQGWKITERGVHRTRHDVWRRRRRRSRSGRSTARIWRRSWRRRRRNWSVPRPCVLARAAAAGVARWRRSPPRGDGAARTSAVTTTRTPRWAICLRRCRLPRRWIWRRRRRCDDLRRKLRSRRNAGRGTGERGS